MLNLNICSPCNNIRGEAHHKRADERADLLGGPQPPPPLLIQAFLSHTVKVHTGTIICPGGTIGDTHASWNSPHTTPLKPTRTERVCQLTPHVEISIMEMVCISRLEYWIEWTTNGWNHNGWPTDAEHAWKNLNTCTNSCRVLRQTYLGWCTVLQYVTKFANNSFKMLILKWSWKNKT